MDGALGLIFKNDYKEILLVKRRDVPIWVLPGGGIEFGETSEQAVIREVLEETGYNVEITRKVGEYTFSGDTKVNYTLECSIQSGNRTLSAESKVIEYFNLNNLPEIISPYIPTYIKDALLKKEGLIVKKFEKLPLTFWLKALKHPLTFFRYLLTKVGIHLDT